jgi:hypothetical protein
LNTYISPLRRAYLKQINNGRIPRGSSAALTLLHSIDVGLDTCHTPGFQDWDLIRSSFENSKAARLLACLSSNRRLPLPVILSRAFKERLTADMVYVLTSFIEAHKYAQYHMPYYLGEEEWAESPEEFLILEESNEEVRAALDALAEISTSSMLLHISRQAARMILCMQEDAVEHFIEEGVLSSEHAEYFLNIIHKNRVTLHAVRALSDLEQLAIPQTLTTDTTAGNAAVTAPAANVNPPPLESRIVPVPGAVGSAHGPEDMV